jgi:hypothetical protein
MFRRLAEGLDLPAAVLIQDVLLTHSRRAAARKRAAAKKRVDLNPGDEGAGCSLPPW